jgi:hypothetical protein
MSQRRFVTCHSSPLKRRFPFVRWRYPLRSKSARNISMASRSSGRRRGYPRAYLLPNRRASANRPRAPGPAVPSARERKVAIRVCLRTRCASFGARLLPHGRTGGSFRKVGDQGACPHASPRLWLQARQPRSRYSSTARLPRTSKHPEHHAIH